MHTDNGKPQQDPVDRFIGWLRKCGDGVVVGAVAGVIAGGVLAYFDWDTRQRNAADAERRDAAYIRFVTMATCGDVEKRRDVAEFVHIEPMWDEITAVATDRDSGLSMHQRLELRRIRAAWERDRDHVVMFDALRDGDWLWDCGPWPPRTAGQGTNEPRIFTPSSD